METTDYLEKAKAIEGLLADCYEAAAMLGEPSVAAMLKKLAAEEINHRNILNMGKVFAKNAPDLFGQAKTSEEDLDASRRAVDSLLNSLRAKEAGLHDLLVRLNELEKRLERVHAAASIGVKDASLRDLFMKLSAGDRNHIDVLTRLIEGL